MTGHGPDHSEADEEEEEVAEQQRKRRKQQEKQQRQRQQQQGKASGAAAQLSEDELFSLLDRHLAADPGGSSAAAAAAAAASSSQKQRQQQARQAAKLWAAFGLAAAPRFGGVDCDLPRLWRCVRQRGGSDAVSRASAWTSVAQDLGIDTKYLGYRNAGFYMAQWFRKFLQPYERSWQQRPGSAAQRHGKAAAAVGLEDAGPAVPG